AIPREGKWRNHSKSFEGMFGRWAGFTVAHIFAEKQIRQSSDNQNVGIKCFQKLRDTPDEFRQLKTGKSTGNSDEPIERRRFKTALPRKAGYQQGADLICAVKIENPLFRKQNSRKEVVREARHFRAAVIKRQRTTRQHPGFLRRLCFPAACREGQIHGDLPLARESLNHGRRTESELSRLMRIGITGGVSYCPRAGRHIL